MANINVVVQDANNVQLNLTPAASTTAIIDGGNQVALELTPTPTQVISLDRGVAGNGIESISVIDIEGSEYLHIVFTNGTTSDVGPIATSTYFGISPIVVTGDTISLSTVPLTLGGTGATTAANARTNLGLGTAATTDASAYATAAQGAKADTAVQPSALGTVASQNANSISITGGSITGITDLAISDGGTGASTASNARTNLGLGTAAVLTAGVALGVATLDAGGTVPLSQIPASIQGGVSYQSAWNASTNSPTLTSSVGTKGYYYVVSTAGSTNLNGVTDWNIGDWAIFNGTVWQKIDNTDAVTSVAGRTGAVVLANTDISGLGTMSTQNANAVAITGGTESGVTHSGDTISNYLDHAAISAPTYVEGRTWYDSASHALAYYNDSANAVVHIGQDLQFKVINNTGSTIANGSPVYITGTSSGQTYPNVALAKADVTSTASVIGLTNGSIANGAIGYVTGQGAIDNVNTGSFTVGQVLYLSPYSAGQLMNTIPPTGITVQVGVVSYVNSSTGKIYVKQTTPLNVPASIISGAVAIANGGTGATTRQGAMDALAGSATSGQYLRGNGTDVVMSAIQAADVPTLNQNTTGTASNVTGTVAITNGGTGATTASTARSNLGSAASGANTDITSVALTTGTVSTTPSSNNDIANKAYVDTYVQGIDAKAACRVASTGNVIAITGLLAIDGITVSVGDRVLLKDQTTSSQNGIYVVSAVAWTRAVDLDVWPEAPGAFTFIEQGTVNAGTGWVTTVTPGGTINVTAMPWSQFSGVGTYTAGTGLSLTGSQFAIDSTVATLTGSQTLTNKTLTNPVINGFTGSTAVVNIGSGQFYKDTSGNVGIGTSSPTAITGYKTLALNGSTGGILYLMNNGSNFGYLYNDTTNIHLGTSGATVLSFDTNATERMRIDSSGNVGIGTSTLNQPLMVKTDTDFVVGIGKGSSGAGARIGAYNLALNAYKDFIVDGATVQFAISGTEKARIDSSGNLLVGTTSSAGFGNNEFRASVSAAGSAVLVAYNSNTADSAPAFNAVKASATTSSSQRFIQFYSNSGATPMGGIVGNGASNVQFAALSDVREKTNIQSISGSLEKINALRPVEFDWIADNTHVNAGFIAQEVETVFPEFVIENMSNDGEEERKGLTGGMTGGIIPHLVKAIQEQQALIEQLRADVETLKAK